MSSSAIGNIYVRGLTGSDGNPGNTGNTGSTGNTGGTGNTGPLGRYYTSYIFDGDSVTITLSDGTTFDLVGTFRGATTLDKSIGVATGSNTGSGQIILSTVAGGTFSFKGLCAYGSLRASYTGANNEYISIDSIYFGTNQIGNSDPTTLSQRELMYLSTKTLAAGADLKHRNDLGLNGICGAFDFAYTTYGGASSDTSNHLNSSSKILNLGPIPIGRYSGLTSTNIIVPNGIGTTLGVFLDAGAAGTFVCKTPIGIQGITGPFKKNEVASISILIDSDDVWKFPSNVYFESDQNYLSCGKNLIGLFTYDGGETWIASVSHRGHGIFNPEYQCIPGYLFGSCCYQNADGRLACNDYSTRKQCDQLFGIFHPGVPCQEACGNDVSVCCTNGKCTENVSITECESFGGSYWAGYTCGFASSDGFNYPIGELNETQIKQQGRFCYNNCPDTEDDVAVCCKDGQCLGNYTRVQCELILGGRSVNVGSCDGVDCCDYTAPNAACCICTTNADGSITSTCEFLSFDECRRRNGNYMGPGKQCNDVACGCICGDTVTQQVGVCCKNGGCISGDYTQSQCDAVSGSWTQGGNCTNCEVPPSPGICCIKNPTTGEGECAFQFTSKESCESNCGHWIDYIVATSPAQGGGPASSDGLGIVSQLTANTVLYNFGQDPGAECEICKLHRPAMYINNSACSYIHSAYKVPFYEKVCNNNLDSPSANGSFIIDFVFGDRTGYGIPLFLNRNLDPNNPRTLLDAIIQTSTQDPSSFDCELCGSMPPSLDSSFMSLACSDIKSNYVRWWYRNTPNYLRHRFGTPCEGVTVAGGSTSITHRYVFRECCGPLSTSISCTQCTDVENCRAQNIPEDDGAIQIGLGFPECNQCECNTSQICAPGKNPLVCGPAELTVTTECYQIKTGSSYETGNCIKCTGLGSIDPNNGTTPPTPTCTPIYDWCDADELPSAFRCSCNPSSSFTTIKVNINNEEIHLPIICDSNCDDFETVT